MRPDISNAFLAAAKAQESGETFVILVTLEHEDLPEPIRLNNAGANLTSRGLPFLASFMQPTILDDDPDRAPRAQLLVSNIDRTMIAALRSTINPCRVTLEMVKASALDYVEFRMTNLEMRTVSYDALLIQGDLTPVRLRARNAVEYRITPNYFPGLF